MRLFKRSGLPKAQFRLFSHEPVAFEPTETITVATCCEPGQACVGVLCASGSFRRRVLCRAECVADQSVLTCEDGESLCGAGALCCASGDGCVCLTGFGQMECLIPSDRVVPAAIFRLRENGKVGAGNEQIGRSKVLRALSGQ